MTNAHTFAYINITFCVLFCDYSFFLGVSFVNISELLEIVWTFSRKQLPDLDDPFQSSQRLSGVNFDECGSFCHVYSETTHTLAGMPMAPS